MKKTTMKKGKRLKRRLTPEDASVLMQYAVWHLDGKEKEFCSVCSDNCHCSASCN